MPCRYSLIHDHVKYRLVVIWFFHFRGNLGYVKEIFPHVHWLQKSDYSSLCQIWNLPCHQLKIIFASFIKTKTETLSAKQKNFHQFLECYSFFLSNFFLFDLAGLARNIFVNTDLWMLGKILDPVKINLLKHWVLHFPPQRRNFLAKDKYFFSTVTFTFTALCFLYFDCNY